MMILRLIRICHKTTKIGIAAFLTFIVNVGYAADLYVGFPGTSGTRHTECLNWELRENVSFMEDTGIYWGPYACTRYITVEDDNGNIYIEKLLASNEVNPIKFSNEVTAKSEWTPSFTQFNGNYYMAYKDGSSNRIYYSWSQDASYWNEPYPVNNLSSISTPQLVVFNGRLYMFFRRSDNVVVYTSTADGVNWSSLSHAGEKSAKPPTFAVFNGKLFMTFRGGTTKNIYVKSTSDGINWNRSVLANQKSSEAPSIAVHNNQLFIAYKGSSTEYIYLIRSSDGESWSSSWIPNQIWKTDKGPAITSYNNQLYLAFKGTNTDRVYYSSSADGMNSWSNYVVRPNAKSKGMLSFAVL